MANPESAQNEINLDMETKLRCRVPQNN